MSLNCNPACLLSDSIAKAGTQARTIQRSAQRGPNIFEMSVSSAFDDHLGGCVQCGKVALEGNVTRSHINPGSHALKRSSASVVSAQDDMLVPEGFV